MNKTWLWNRSAVALAPAIVVLAIGASSCKPRADVGVAPIQSTSSLLGVVASAPDSGSSSVTLDTESTASGAPSSAPAAAVLLKHCKALGKRGLITIGTYSDAHVAMVAHAGELFVLSYSQPLARSSLARLPREGGKAKLLGRHTGPGVPSGLVVGAAAAYFTHNRALFMAPFEGGELTQLAEHFSRVIELRGDDIYGVTCEQKGRTDHLVRIKTTGGPVATLAGLERTAQGKCNYKAIASDDKTLFLGDWEARRVLAVSLADNSVSELARDRTFPSRILVESENIVLLSAGGLYRIARADGKTTKLTADAPSPAGILAEDTKDFWLYDLQGFTNEQWLYRVPRAGGATQKVISFHDTSGSNPNDIDILGMTVDDECIYLARNYNTENMTLVARDKDN